MKKDQPDYNPKSLSEGGAILEAIVKGHFTMYELKFLIMVYRWSYGFQRRSTPAKEKHKWAQLMNLSRQNFRKIRKWLESRKIVVCRDYGYSLAMRFETDKSKWDMESVQTTSKRYAKNRELVVCRESFGSLEGVPPVVCRESFGSLEGVPLSSSRLLEDKRIEEVLEEAETATSSPPFSPSKKGKSKEKIPYLHVKRTRAQHRKILEEQKENLLKTGRPEG